MGVVAVAINLKTTRYKKHTHSNIVTWPHFLLANDYQWTPEKVMKQARYCNDRVYLRPI